MENYIENIKKGLSNVNLYEEPFNFDIFILEKVLELRDKFCLKNAIETGSFIYVTSEWLANNFQELTTFEKSEDLYEKYSEKIKEYNNVQAINEDSVQGLRNNISKITDHTFIYLDAHWAESFPLLEELQVIADSLAKPVIAIHDFKVPEKEDRYYYSFEGKDLDTEYVKPLLEKIYGENGYELSFLEQCGPTPVGCVFINKK